MELFNSKRKVYAAIMAVATILFSAYYFTRNKQKIVHQPVTVQTETIKKDSISVKANFIAKVRTFESVTLSSEVVGRIVYMKKDGSFTKKGELILELDSTEAEGRYMRALGRKNEEELKLKTTEDMFKEGYKSKMHVDEQKAKYQTALGELKEAQANLNKHKIKAPFNGVIGLHTQSLGATITHNTKLVSISNLENLQIEFTITDSELRELGGMEKIKDANFFMTLEGHLLSIPAKFSAAETVLDAETNTLAIRANLIPEPGEKSASPGQIGQATVTTGTKENVITVPESSIERGHGVEYVYKVVNGIAVQLAVKCGIKDGERTEILEGLVEGDIIVTSGRYGLTDGQKVIIEE